MYDWPSRTPRKERGRSRPIRGSATLTTVEPRKTIAEPSTAATRIQRLAVTQKPYRVSAWNIPDSAARLLEDGLRSRSPQMGRLDGHHGQQDQDPARDLNARQAISQQQDGEQDRDHRLPRAEQRRPIGADAR